LNASAFAVCWFLVLCCISNQIGVWTTGIDVWGIKQDAVTAVQQWLRPSLNAVCDARIKLTCNKVSEQVYGFCTSVCVVRLLAHRLLPRSPHRCDTASRSLQPVQPLKLEMLASFNLFAGLSTTLYASETPIAEEEEGLHGVHKRLRRDKHPKI
jgi:hypothetical protein